jgi:hypothetical protein
MSTQRPKIPNVSQNGFSSFRTDLFGRIKTSEAYTVFESIHRYEKSADFSEYTSGTASITYLEHESALSLAVGSNSGDTVTLESFKVFPFQTGKSLQIMQTFSLGEPKENLRQRVGYFSRTNGIYLEKDGNQTNIVWRSFVTGSLVETRIAQQDWNIDALDGEGPSDYVLDLTKSQMLWIELTSMNSGSARIGFAIDGFYIPVHQINNSNNRTTPLFTTASLPMRFEITNTGSTIGTSAMKQMSSAVISNGGIAKQTEQWTVVTNGEVTVGEEYTPLVALRLASGRTDAVVTTSALNIYPVSNDDFEWALIKNPTTFTGGTWTTYYPKNNVQFNKTATSMSGGVALFQGFFGSQNQNPVPMAEQSTDNFAYQLGRTNTDSPVSDVFVLCCRVVNGTGTVKASLSWYDII